MVYACIVVIFVSGSVAVFVSFVSVLSMLSPWNSMTASASSSGSSIDTSCFGFGVGGRYGVCVESAEPSMSVDGDG